MIFPPKYLKLLFIFNAFAFKFLFASNLAVAQNIPVPDDTLGSENSRVESLGAIDAVSGGATRGSNLFHSFREFNVGAGRGVYFFAPNAEIQNILARVTGRNRSEILGVLGTRVFDGTTISNSNANLFLINPNGIVFGENASLDVGGSFVATTANAVQFGEQGVFSATNPAVPQLLTINPSVFLFSQINQNTGIQNNSKAPAGQNPSGGDSFGLRVPDDKSLLLVGGNISMDGGQLNALGGRVELGGLAEPGNVELLFNGDNLNLKFTENVTRADVSLTNKAGIYVTGTGGGNLAINARNVEILQGSILSAGILRGLGTPDTVAGDITLNATGEIKVADSGSEIRNLVRENSKGNGGNIFINSGSFSLRDSAQLQALTFGEGNAGNVTVSAKDTVSLAGNAYIFTTVEVGGVGKGGNIDINAGKLSLTDASKLITITRGVSDIKPAGRGDAGNVKLKVTGAVDIAGFGSGIDSSVGTEAVGNGGNISIDAGSFKLQDSAQLQALTFGEGNAGNVTVSAKDTVSLAGNAYIFTTVEAGGVGKGGNIDINAGKLSLTDGAQLLATTRGSDGTEPAGRGDAGNVNLKVTGEVDIAGFGSEIDSSVDTGAIGNGGNISIDAASFKLQDGAKLQSSTYGQGNAGNVTVSVKDAVFLTGNARIFSAVEAWGVGKGGNITINATTLSLADDARLSSSTFGQGNAGNIDVKAGQLSLLNESAIIASTDSQSNSGNIIVNTNQLILQDGSFILTDALPNSTGRGGNITVNSTESIAISGISEDNNASGLYAQTRGAGRAGDIQVTTKRLTVRDGGTISGETSGSGKAGDLTIDASELVEVIGGAPNDQFSSSIGVQVSENASGNAGNLRINTKRLLARDGAFIASGTRENSTGNGGNLLINATDSVELIGRTLDSENPTAISVDVINGGTGNAGSLTINTQRLVIKDGAEVAAKNIGSGQPGQILINADESVEVIGGKDTLTLINAVAGPNATGKPGDIRINTKRLLLQDGGQIAALTFGKVDGGTIQINATDFIEISGEALGLDNVFPFFRGSGISSVSVPLTDDVGGNGGDIKIQTGNLNLTNNGQISTATGVGVGIAGNAGNIEITSSKITLNNQGKLSAESASGNGGNINLNSNLLLLRRGSQISTTAGTAQAGGDGGNINLNTKFIVAVPGENSDITANAFTGRGGNINITSRGIFGIEPRTQRTNQSDITASSELGIAGNINNNTPDNSGIQNSLADLPNNQIDTNALIASSCINRTASQNSTFFIVGKGGIPIRPNDAPLPNYSTGSIRSLGTTDSRRPWKIGDPIVEPTGVYKLPDGKLILSRECS